MTTTRAPSASRPPSPRSAATPADGRAARSQRTRDAVVEAFLELLEAGERQPTTRQIAERAGVSVRSVFVRFEDLDGVASAAAQRQWERVRAITTRLPTDGPLPERLETFVEQRCRVLELLAPVRRVAEAEERSGTALASLLAWARSLARREVAQMFATELRALSPATRVAVLDALDVASGSSTWEALRSHRDLPEPAARRVVTTMLGALLARPSEPDLEP